MSRQPLAEARDVAFAYAGGPRVLDGVSFAVGPGEVVAIAGANGAGKSTLARLLNGLLRPTAGTVLVDGTDASRSPVHRLASTVGLVFQDARTQLFARTVAEELAFGPRNLGLSASEVAVRVAAEAARFGLGEDLGRSPFELTAPRRRLVALASVLAMRPRVLVLDEPTTGQDDAVGALVAGLAGSLAAEGTAVVLISHDMRLLAGVATRVLVLAGGRVVADGLPHAVFADEAVLDRAGLAAPQVTRLAAMLPAFGGRPLPLTVGELVAGLGRAVLAAPAPASPVDTRGGDG